MADQFIHAFANSTHPPEPPAEDSDDAPAQATLRRSNTPECSPPTYRDDTVINNGQGVNTLWMKDSISSSSCNHTSAPSSKNCDAIKYLLTAALFYSWVCLGLYAEVLGPALTTLMHDIPASYKEIGQALSVREVGMFFGSLLGAVLADRFVSRRSCTIAISQVVGAITIFTVAWCRNLPSLCATLFFSGCAHGALTSNGNPLLGSIWGDHAAGPFNFMHAGYGVGAALAPLLLSPFTFDANFTVHDSISTESNSSLPDGKSDLVHMLPPCSIIAGLCLLSGLFLISLRCQQSHVCSAPTSSNSSLTGAGDEAETVSPHKSPSSKSCGAHLRRSFNFLLSQRAAFLLIPSIFALYFALVGNERVFSKYAFAWAVYGPAKFTSKDSYLFVTSYWISFSLARIATFLVSLLVPIRWLFLLQLVGTWGISLGLVFAPAERPYVYALTVLFGLFKSPLFPSGLSVINEAVEVSGFIVFFVNLGSSIGASSMQAIAGYLIHLHREEVFPMTVMVTALVLLLIGLSLLVAVHIVKRRNGRATLTHVEPDSNQEAVF